MSPKLKIGLLLAAHIVAGLVLAWTGIPAATAFPIALFGLFPLVFAEAGLIGFWGGLSAIRLVFRLFAVLAATLYLWAVFVVPIRGGDIYAVLPVIALTVVPIIVVLVVLRHSRRKLRQQLWPSCWGLAEAFGLSVLPSRTWWPWRPSLPASSWSSWLRFGRHLDLDDRYLDWPSWCRLPSSWVPYRFFICQTYPVRKLGDTSSCQSSSQFKPSSPPPLCWSFDLAVGGW